MAQGLGLAGGFGAGAGADALERMAIERAKAIQQEFDNQRRVEEFSQRQRLADRGQTLDETKWTDLAPQRDATVGLTTAQTGLTEANTARTTGVEGRDAEEYGVLKGLRMDADEAMAGMPTPEGRLPLRAAGAIKQAYGIDVTTPGGDTAAYGPGSTASQAWQGGERGIYQDRANIDAGAAMRVNSARQQAAGGGAAGSPEGPSEYSLERETRVMDSIDTLLGKVNNWTAGPGSLLSAVPGTDATDFAAELDTLKANIAFNELTQMREASKTGGALGQVSNIELGLLESALGALNPRQSPENLRQQLGKIRGSIERWRAARDASLGAGDGGAATPAVGGGSVRRFERGPDGQIRMVGQ